MKISNFASAVLVLAGSSSSTVVNAYDFGEFLRGSTSLASSYDHSVESYVGQFACTLSGGSKCIDSSLNRGIVVISFLWFCSNSKFPYSSSSSSLSTPIPADQSTCDASKSEDGSKCTYHLFERDRSTAFLRLSK
jgi:hypothetical protein